MNNKLLAIVFFALLGLLVAKKTILKPKTKSFKTELTNFNVDEIDKVTVQIGSEPMTTLSKSGDSWTVSDGIRDLDAKVTTVEGLIQDMSNVKTKQLVSRNSEKWADYEVDDALGKKVVLYSNGKKVVGLHVGRFNFNQQTRSGVSYARSSDEDDIYSLEGFLAMSVGKDFNSFRETNMMNFDQTEVQEVVLDTGGKQTSLSKDLDGGWVVDGIAIDSSSAARYISGLTNLNGRDFVDGFSETNATIHSTLTTTDNIVTTYSTSDGFVIKSNKNPAYFASDSSGVFKRLITDFLDLKSI